MKFGQIVEDSAKEYESSFPKDFAPDGIVGSTAAAASPDLQLQLRRCSECRPPPPLGCASALHRPANAVLPQEGGEHSPRGTEQTHADYPALN